MHPFPLQLFVAKPSLEDHVAEEDLMSSAASSRRESYCSSDGDQLRRRSSTSDVLRFRQRMRQTSTHESHEEIVDPVEDSKGDAKSKNVSEPEITITAASDASGGSSDAHSTATQSSRSAEEVMVVAGKSSLASNLETNGAEPRPRPDEPPTKTTVNMNNSLIENVTYDL